MRITITGATGLIGAGLRRHLMASGHELRCLSRKPLAQTGWFAWDTLAGGPPRESLEGSEAVIHLAGEPIAQRWSLEVKRRIRSSRAEGTAALVKSLAALPRRPSVLVSASAIGYYGDRADESLTEQALPGSDFLSEVCVEWERAAELARESGIRVVCVRIGRVLHPRGGALGQMRPIVRAGLGGPMAGGQAWLSWVHREDLMRLFTWALETSTVQGPVNAVAPGAVRNGEFMRTLGTTLHRPAFLPVPAFALRLLYGEMAGVILRSQHVIPEVAEQAGFQFSWPQLAPALQNLLG